jgi:hypothetical protein
VLDAVFEPHAFQRGTRLGLVRRAVKILRQHHIFKSGEIGHQMELLKDEADLLGAEARQPFFIEPRHVDAAHHGLAGSGRVEPAENIDQRGLPRARGAHDGDPFAFFHAERNAVERAHVAEFFFQVFDLYDGRHFCVR